MNPVTRYVMVLAIDPATGFVVGITKKKGPKFLLNKLTFPGGKIEQGEAAELAASRELKEEVLLDVPAEAMRLVSLDTGEGYELHTFACVSDKVLHARQMEEEPVWHLAISRHLEYCVSQPEQYAPDFREKLTAALALVAPGLLTPAAEPAAV